MSQGRGFDTEWLQKLRDANDIVSCVSKYCMLKRQGRKYWACCPFHHERTPSFCVNDDEQFYHCFGCGESGDVIAFVMKIESLDFMDAVKYLATQAGLELPEFKGEREIFERKQKKDRLLNLLKSANDYYKAELTGKNGQNALNYLNARGLTQKEIEKFEIGYSSSWDGVLKHLSAQGFSLDEMREVGIVTTDEYGKNFDFFALRLMFPLLNKFGDCVGFSGRDITGKSKAKYKNSTQSIVFDKSATVFALNHVKTLKQSENVKKIIICEGQIDVIAMHKAGFNTAVACLGTAITERHAKELKRVVDSVTLCLDNDEAGVIAALRAIPVLKSQGLEVRVATLTGGKDPDEIIAKHGKEYMSNIIAQSKDCIEYQIEIAATRYDLNDGSGKSKFLSEAFNLLKELPSKSEREYYIPLISRLSKVPQNIVREDVSSISMVNNRQSEQIENTNALLDKRFDALIRAQVFIMASFINAKPYAVLDDDFDMLLKDSELIKLYNYIKEKVQNKQTINKVIVFDDFGDTNQTIKECLNYDFDKIPNGDESGYFNSCVKTIRLRAVEMKIDEIQEQIAACTNIDLKRSLVQSLSILLKEKQKWK